MVQPLGSGLRERADARDNRDVLAPDADPRHGRFGLRTDCPRCGEHLPVNGPAPHVDCAACGHRTDVPPSLLRDLMRDFERGWPSPQPGGTVIQGDLTWRWTAVPVDGPTCACGGYYDEPHTMRDTVRCATCGGTAPVIPPPDALRRQVGSLKAIIGGGEDQSRPQGPPEPVALQCPSCSGGLSIDASRERITRCEFCGSQVHLPDAVWRLLHPPREVREWFGRFEGESEAAKRMRKEAEKAQRREEQEAKKAEKQRAKDEQRAARQAEKDKAAAEKRAVRQAEEAQRQRYGFVATALVWVLCLGASATMSLTIALWAAPVAGLGDMPGLTEGLVAAGAASFAVAWLVGHVVAAWRSRLAIGSSLFFSALMAIMLVLPPVSMFSGFLIGGFYVYGRFPTPGGEQYKNFRHRHRVGWALALMFVVTGFFATAAVGSLFDLTVGEMLEALPED